MERKEKEVKKEEKNLIDCCTMWIAKGKKGTEFLKGKDTDGNRLVGFFNGKKKNPKDPDIRILFADQKGNAEEEAIALWQSTSKAGKTYYYGKTNEKVDVVAFENLKMENERAPFLNVYFRKVENA